MTILLLGMYSRPAFYMIAQIDPCRLKWGGVGFACTLLAVYGVATWRYSCRNWFIRSSGSGAVMRGSVSLSTKYVHVAVLSLDTVPTRVVLTSQAHFSCMTAGPNIALGKKAVGNSDNTLFTNHTCYLKLRNHLPYQHLHCSTHCDISAYAE